MVGASVGVSVGASVVGAAVVGEFVGESTDEVVPRMLLVKESNRPPDVDGLSVDGVSVDTGAVVGPDIPASVLVGD